MSAQLHRSDLRIYWVAGLYNEIAVTLLGYFGPAFFCLMTVAAPVQSPQELRKLLSLMGT
jgi:hypothetical protein